VTDSVPLTKDDSEEKTTFDACAFGHSDANVAIHGCRPEVNTCVERTETARTPSSRRLHGGICRLSPEKRAAGCGDFGHGPNLRLSRETGVEIDWMAEFLSITPWPLASAEPYTCPARTILRRIPWQCLVVDEGQRLKNDDTQLYNELQKYKLLQKVLLIGTPLQSNPPRTGKSLFGLSRYQKCFSLPRTTVTSPLVRCSKTSPGSSFDVQKCRTRWLHEATTDDLDPHEETRSDNGDDEMEFDSESDEIKPK
jgi:hypothetical protein